MTGTAVMSRVLPGRCVDTGGMPGAAGAWVPRLTLVLKTGVAFALFCGVMILCIGDCRLVMGSMVGGPGYSVVCGCICGLLMHSGRAWVAVFASVSS